MVDGLTWERNSPDLQRPVLLAGFEGWNDAADAASNAAVWLTQHGTGEAERVASIDPEVHFDFQSRRPHVTLAGGVTRSITWPENIFFTVPRDERDLVVLRGVEPSYKWHSFCRAVVSVAQATSCEMVITFGALLADVPHTREARVTGTATDPDLVARLGLAQSRYEGPTGIVGVLHDHCRSQGIDSVSLWAPVPHYLAAPPNPPATLALLDRAAGLLDLQLDLGRLERTAVAWREKVDEVAASDDDVRGYVRTLEERFDAAEPDAETSWGANLPSGDELAKEVERFLRDQREG
ncbi:MAG: PAC2 family protein [Actinobacteria bacterium]|nr:PAC2 family protein [Actinomycetota bacterium]